MSLMLDQSYPAGEEDELSPRLWGRLFTRDGPRTGCSGMNGSLLQEAK